jgi:carbonic anhydrase
MDARLDPAKYAGLAEGDAHVIRNAGGRASADAIRSLVISYKLLGTREWFVIHHTDCGMLLFTNDDMRSLLASSLKTATLDQSGWRDSGEDGGVRRAKRGSRRSLSEPWYRCLLGSSSTYPMEAIPCKAQCRISPF